MQDAPFAVEPAHKANSQLYRDVLRHAEAMFDAVRSELLAYDVTNFVRGQLLKPITSISLKQVRAP